jgi:integrase
MLIEDKSFNTKFKQKLTDDFKAKDLSDSSINLYLRNLEKMNDNQPLKNLKFLDDVEAIQKKLEHYKQNTIRNYLISCVSVLSLDKSTKKKENLYNQYFKLMMEKNSELKKKEATGEKSETQTKNWVEWSEVLKTYENLKKLVDEFKNKSSITTKQYKYLLEFIVLSLYVLLPPRRNEFRNMFIVNKLSDTHTNACNYIVLSTKQLIFNQFKTSKKEGALHEDIPNELYENLLVYLKFHPLLKGKKLKPNQMIPFLVYDDGKPLESINSITRILNSIFKLKVGSSMLRKSYLTSKYGNIRQEMKDDAKAMSHSINTQQTSYVKV